jgi:hypothetical protein
MEAVQQGWQGFTRAPWVFIGFTLLAGLLNIICSLIQGQVDEATVITGAQAIRLLIGSILAIFLSLWTTTGMIRGAWTALAGGCPTLGTFTRWDGQAAWRLFRNSIVVAAVFALLLAAALLLGVGVAQVVRALAVMPLLVAIGVMLYLAVNQKFLAQIALLEGKGPLESIAQGRRLIDPQWGSVLLLGVIEILVLLLGLLAFFVGLFAAAPVVMCISTAAYRQIFGTEDLTGLLSEPVA